MTCWFQALVTLIEPVSATDKLSNVPIGATIGTVYPRNDDKTRGVEGGIGVAQATPMKMHLAHFSYLVGFLCAACSGTANNDNTNAGGNSSSGGAGLGGTSSPGGGSATGGVTVLTTGTGPTACGATACSAAQYCVIPCCGGVAPACFPIGDGGVCPSGSHSGCSAPTTNSCVTGFTCCQANPCTPPAPYCSDALPVSCMLSGRTCRMMCA